jgi:thrombospondin motif-containing protein 9
MSCRGCWITTLSHGPGPIAVAISSPSISSKSHPYHFFSVHLIFFSIYLFLYLIISSGGYGECLLDKPSTDLLDAHRAAKKLPGENFDENKQCELVFGHGSKICPYMVNIMIII